MELTGQEEPTPVVVTSKNWYRMLLKTCKELDNLIYWKASPVENCALKALPVTQQAQLFRVMLEHWLTKCHPEVDDLEDSEEDSEKRFQMLGYDDKGDCYWRYAGRLYREEMPLTAAGTPSADAAVDGDSSDEPQRSIRQKHKRERLAVTESANFLRRTLLEPTTRSTRNSVGRFANDLFLEEERIAGRNERLRQESLETFEARTGLPLRWLGKRDHVTTLAIDQPSIEALLFILKAGTSERMKDLVLAIEHDMLPAPSTTNGNGKEKKVKSESSKPAKKTPKKEELEEVEVKEVETKVDAETNGSRESSPASSPRRPTRKTRSRAAKEASMQSSIESSRAPSPTPDTATVTTATTGSTELPTDATPESEVNTSAMEISEPENGNGADDEAIEKHDEAMKVDEDDASSDSAGDILAAAAAAAAAATATQESDAEDSAITALMGAVVSEEANDSSETNGLKDEDVKVDQSIRSNASSSPDSSMVLDAPRQKRQAAVKSRQMLSNGLHGVVIDDNFSGRQDRKRPRSASDELVLRLRITPQVRRAIRAEMEEEEPIRKKPVFRAPSPPRRRPADNHALQALANLEEEALSVLSTPNNSLAAAMVPNLAALNPAALGGIPLSAYAGFNQQMLSPFASMYGSPYLQAFSQLGFGMDPSMALLGYNPLLAANGISPQEMLLQQQRQQIYQQQLLEAHFLQQQQLMLQQRLAQQHPGLSIDPTRITVPLATSSATVTVSVPIPEAQPIIQQQPMLLQQQQTPSVGATIADIGFVSIPQNNNPFALPTAVEEPVEQVPPPVEATPSPSSSLVVTTVSTESDAVAAEPIASEPTSIVEPVAEPEERAEETAAASLASVVATFIPSI